MFTRCVHEYRDEIMVNYVGRYYVYFTLKKETQNKFTTREYNINIL